MTRPPDGYVDAPAYLQIEAERYNYGGEGVRGAKVVGITQKRPVSPRRGVIVVKVTLRIPIAAFEPLQPEAVVVIPTSLTEPHPIEVEAQDPREDTDHG
jgi:hypothetical protein